MVAQVEAVLVFCLPGHNKKGANRTMKVKWFVRTKEYVWHQNKNYVGGANC